MSTVQEQISASTCYGVAFDATIKECKICEIRKECELKSKGDASTKPTKPEKAEGKSTDVKDTSKTTSAKSTTPTKAKAIDTKKADIKPADKPTVTKKTNDVMPDFKEMELEALAKLADERGVDPKWREYANDGIKRMRVTMALKKTY